MYSLVAVICYYQSWAAYDGVMPDNFDASLCTHVNYAFISVASDGKLKVEDQDLDVDQGLYKKVTDMKKKNSKLKVLLSVGGESSGTLFSGVAASATKRKNFVTSAESYLSKYNFDGLDVDWEYPETKDKAHYIELLKELKEAFKTNGYLLTAAVSSEVDEHGYDFTQMDKYLDIINLMTYDFYGDWSDYTGQNSPLYASSVESSYEKTHLNVAVSAKNWVNAGVPKSKLAIGTAFYGRSFTLESSKNHGLHAAFSGPGKDGGEPAYSTICAKYESWTEVWDDEQKNPYKYSGNQWLGYDDQKSIQDKAKWIKENGYFGVMIWSIDQDDVHGKCGEKQLLLKEINKDIK